MEQIPEKFLDENGELNTSALVKSYCELEKKMGNMISVPKDDADIDAKQKFNHAIGVPDNASEYPINDLFDDESVREKCIFWDANKKLLIPYNECKFSKVCNKSITSCNIAIKKICQTCYTENHTCNNIVIWNCWYK